MIFPYFLDFRKTHQVYVLERLKQIREDETTCHDSYPLATSALDVCDSLSVREFFSGFATWTTEMLSFAPRCSSRSGADELSLLQFMRRACTALSLVWASATTNHCSFPTAPNALLSILLCACTLVNSLFPRSAPCYGWPKKRRKSRRLLQALSLHCTTSYTQSNRNGDGRSPRPSNFGPMATPARI